MHNNQTTVEEHTVLAHPNKSDPVHGKSFSCMTVKQTNQAFEELRRRSRLSTAVNKAIKVEHV